ncbi:MAG: hypothetical protein NXI32_11370 [bacterium]|nr:hypothetical protein [bacterium]
MRYDNLRIGDLVSERRQVASTWSESEREERRLIALCKQNLLAQLMGLSSPACGHRREPELVSTAG